MNAPPPGQPVATPPEPLAPYGPARRRTLVLSDAPDSAGAYLAALRRRPLLVIGLPVIFAAAALAISLARPRTYEARAAFLASEPAPASNSLGALSSVASQLGIPALSSVASNSASLSAMFYGDLLRSRALLHTVVMTRYAARSVAENGGEPFEGTLVDYLRARGRTATDREIDAMNRFDRKVLVVTVDRPTGIVRLSVRTKNRELSAIVARRLLELVNEFNLRRRQTQAGAERDFAGHRAQAALDTLHAAEAALAEFRATNVDFTRSPRLAIREAELQRRVSFALQIYTTVAQRYELTSIEAVRNTPVVTVLDAPEGLVEARPRYTAFIAAGALLVGLALGCVVALAAEGRRRKSLLASP